MPSQQLFEKTHRRPRRERCQHLNNHPPYHTLNHSHPQYHTLGHNLKIILMEDDLVRQL
ncbi:hypothetical protein NA56DRAFT_708335 [Hyaloscypha hepaticicola]|uniref:Uncharacterized protein n=1 Tax=Hyaloscypha hepaticicola TaxID=2082293 RepID=A0A2J6PRZ7_9HELO|nr:hypothetical protein NA56DRAFT_708335 [Hyaloscypha hepaticicola]